MLLDTGLLVVAPPTPSFSCWFGIELPSDMASPRSFGALPPSCLRSDNKHPLRKRPTPNKLASCRTQNTPVAYADVGPTEIPIFRASREDGTAKYSAAPVTPTAAPAQNVTVE